MGKEQRELPDIQIAEIERLIDEFKEKFNLNSC